MSNLRRLLVSVCVLMVVLAFAHMVGSGLYRRPAGFSNVVELNHPDCRIGVTDGTGAEQISRAEFPSAQTSVFGDCESACVALLAGRLEAVVGYESQLNLAARAYPSRFAILDEMLDRDEAVVVVSPFHTNLTGRINRFVANYRRLGFYDDAYCRWCQSDEFVSMPEVPSAGTNAPPLRIGTSGDSEPTSFFTDGGDLVGYDVEFGRRLAQYLRNRPMFVCAPRDELIAKLRDGELDVVIDAVLVGDVANGLQHSDSYLDIDTRVMVRGKDDNGGMLGATRLGYSSRMFSDQRLTLFVEGFFTTLAITVLSALLGFGIAFSVRAVDRRLPVMMQMVVAMGLEVFRLLPPPIVFLIFGCTGSSVFSSWLAAIVSLACWFAADIEPMCGLGARPVLSVVRTKLVGLMQWTSIVGCLNICDLATAADIVCGRTPQALMPLVSVAAAYCLMNWLIKRGVDFLEERLP